MILNFRDKSSKIFGITLLGSMILLVFISYETSIEQHLGLQYLKHTFNQSASNFELINESRMLHISQLQHEHQLGTFAQQINDTLLVMNHTLNEIRGEHKI